MNRTFLLCIAASVLAACSSTPTPAKTPTDTVAAADVAAQDSAAPDVAAPDIAKDAAADIAKDVAAPACATRAGAYAVQGKCSNGGSSIPFACMLAKDCELTWVADYRTWSGPLKGNDFALVGAAGADTITGTFTGPEAGSYTYAGGGLTCEATMAQIAPITALSLCCDVMAQECGAGNGCVVVPASTDADAPYTTGCLPLAADATTTEGGACTASLQQAGCAPGLACFLKPGATKASDARCVKQCQKATDCGAGQQCDIVTSAPRSGACAAPCDPMAAGACATGQFCGLTTVADADYKRLLSATCVAAGTGAGKDGAACTYSSDCAAGLACTAGGCKALCDSAHPCAAGACTGFGLPSAKGMPAGFGFCK